MERTLTWHPLVLGLVQTDCIVAFISANKSINESSGARRERKGPYASAARAACASAVGVGARVAWTHCDWLVVVGLVWCGLV